MFHDPSNMRLREGGREERERERAFGRREKGQRVRTEGLVTVSNKKRERERERERDFIRNVAVQKVGVCSNGKTLARVIFHGRCFKHASLYFILFYVNLFYFLV